MQSYIQSDKLQKLIDWQKIMKMPREAGGHDKQMKGLFKHVEIIAYYHENGWSGQTAACVKFIKGLFKDKFVIYNDYYGSCSMCDSWDGASDEEVKHLCINLSNSAYIFSSLDDVKKFLSTIEHNSDWSRWSDITKAFLDHINSGTIDDYEI